MNTSKRVIKLIMQMVLIVAVLLIVDTLNTFFRGGYVNKKEISFDANQITFSDASGGEIVIPYSDIVSIEWMEAPDYGQPTDGSIQDNIRVGTWESAEMGTYVSHTAIDIESCLLIQTSSHIYAVNYENDETTRLLVDEINNYR